MRVLRSHDMKKLDVRPEQSLALAYAPPRLKAPFSLMLCLDASFALVAARGQEPVLKQLRLAWWREQILKSPDARSSNDPMLLALSAVESTHPELALPGLCATLLDGWSELVSAEGEDIDQAIARCVERRAAAIFGGYSQWIGATREDELSAIRLGENWARLTLGGASALDNVMMPRRLKALSLLEMTARVGTQTLGMARLAGMLRIYGYALTNL
jgi:hypothetical protein